MGNSIFYTVISFLTMMKMLDIIQVAQCSQFLKYKSLRATHTGVRAVMLVLAVCVVFGDAAKRDAEQAIQNTQGPQGQPGSQNSSVSTGESLLEAAVKEKKVADHDSGRSNPLSNYEHICTDESEEHRKKNKFWPLPEWRWENPNVAKGNQKWQGDNDITKCTSYNEQGWDTNCTNCQGTGKIKDDKASNGEKKCPTCKGKGDKQCKAPVDWFFNRRHHCRMCLRVFCTSKECIRDVILKLPILHTGDPSKRIQGTDILEEQLRLYICDRCMKYYMKESYKNATFKNGQFSDDGKIDAGFTTALFDALNNTSRLEKMYRNCEFYMKPNDK